MAVSPHPTEVHFFPCEVLRHGNLGLSQYELTSKLEKAKSPRGVNGIGITLHLSNDTAASNPSHSVPAGWPGCEEGAPGCFSSR